MISVRLSEETKQKLEKIAVEQHRPLSNLIRVVLLEWLEKQEKPKKNR